MSVYQRWRTPKEGTAPIPVSVAFASYQFSYSSCYCAPKRGASYRHRGFSRIPARHTAAVIYGRLSFGLLSLHLLAYLCLFLRGFSDRVRPPATKHSAAEHTPSSGWQKTKTTTEKARDRVRGKGKRWSRTQAKARRRATVCRRRVANLKEEKNEAGKETMLGHLSVRGGITPRFELFS